MSFKLTDYSPSSYSDILVGIGFVWKHLDVRGGSNLVVEKLGPIFRKHGVDTKFGLAILHRHFDLAPNERLVEVNDVTTPWDVNEAATVEGSITPTSWLFSGNSLVPYEYAFVDSKSATALGEQPSAFPAFIAELGTALKALKVQRYLALTAHPGPDFKGSVEFTVGRTNVSVASDRMSDHHTLEATFFFNSGYDAKQSKKKCKYKKCDYKLQAHDLANMEELD